ncbi:MAG: hypothetical protein MHM6MM_000074 [Cercozoa sp. M6MM]
MPSAVLALVAEVTVRTLITLSDSLNVNSYTALCQKVLGNRSAFLLCACATAFDFGSAWAYIAASLELTQLHLYTSRLTSRAIAAMVLVSLLAVTKDPMRLSVLTGVATVIVLLAMGFTLVSAASLPPMVTSVSWVTPRTVDAFAVLAFSFMYHEAIFAFRDTAPSTQHFLHSNCLGLLVATVLMVTWGTLCALLFPVAENVLLSPALQRLPWLSLGVRGVVAVCYMSVAVMMSYFTREYAYALVHLPDMETNLPLPTNAHMLSTFAIGAALFLATLLPVSATAVIDLVGLVTGVLLGMVFPVLIYVRAKSIKWARALQYFSLSMTSIIALVGFVFGTMLWVHQYLLHNNSAMNESAGISIPETSEG